MQRGTCTFPVPEQPTPRLILPDGLRVCESCRKFRAVYRVTVRRADDGDFDLWCPKCIAHYAEVLDVHYV